VPELARQCLPACRLRSVSVRVAAPDRRPVTGNGCDHLPRRAGALRDRVPRHRQQVCTGVINRSVARAVPVPLDQRRHVDAHAGDASQDFGGPRLALAARDGILGVGQGCLDLPLALCRYGYEHLGGAIHGLSPSVWQPLGALRKLHRS
jgi:hypothetical protein